MKLSTITILNYKNIAEATLTFSPKFNCLIGNNGEGKTNLLDAIYYLSFCHSMSTNIDSTVMRHEADCFMLQGNYLADRPDLPDEEIHAAAKRGARKTFRRNKKPYKHLSEHIGLIPLIIASPDDTSLITGSSDERRKLLDIVIAQYDQTYIPALNRYNKALQQRNALLKLETVEPDPTLLSLWEEQMAAEGEHIYQRRAEFIERFTPVFCDMYQRIAGGHEQVSLKYTSHCQRGPLLDVIQRDRLKDRAVGYSLHGIHRDDLEMLIDSYPIRREGSQGQTKTYVIALKLAQFDFLRQTVSATTPLLLLDDIFDKLDANRVENIVKMVSSSDFGQIFITDTNRSHLDSILSHSNAPHTIFRVENGTFTAL